MSNPNEFKRDVVCGVVCWRKYAAYKKPGTNDWFTNQCEQAATAIVPGSPCHAFPFPANPITGDPAITLTYPTYRTPNAKDYDDGGYRRYYIATDASSTPPNVFLYVDYATP